MSRPASPRQVPHSPVYEDAYMQPEFPTQPVQMEHLFQAMSNMLLQVNHTNQSLLNFLSSSATHNHRPDPKIRPKSFSGLPTEDVLMWLDHFEIVSSYHNWSEERKAMEVHTLLEDVAATWFIQQQEDIKGNWQVLKALLIQNFAHQNITQTALQQLNALKKQQLEPVAQFAVKMNQLLLRADPTMSEDMKLFFLWPRLRHDISRQVRDQSPTSFHAAIQIAQRIEASANPDAPTTLVHQPVTHHHLVESNPMPMDIDIQNAQVNSIA
ncbi:hypothetical protein L7F22_000556 [Adiantum nelumboides]|nr:hypothetical protein [Adiantum nelumboides]